MHDRDRIPAASPTRCREVRLARAPRGAKAPSVASDRGDVARDPRANPRKTMSASSTQTVRSNRPARVGAVLALAVVTVASSTLASASPAMADAEVFESPAVFATASAASAASATSATSAGGLPAATPQSVHESSAAVWEAKRSSALLAAQRITDSHEADEVQAVAAAKAATAAKAAKAAKAAAAEAKRAKRAQRARAASANWPGQGSSSTEAFRRCVVKRESEGQYNVVDPSGTWFGAYQFAMGTSNEAARRMGRRDLVGVPANQWSRSEQDAAFYVIYQGGAGRGHWAGGRYAC